ncbi:hypothetical protein G9464_01315 [Halostella sp. JP-L12]|uniref:hypothetical protein n=1 Tax=Halostella TaxID=1843185 RepID=UPI000EF7D52E|nr:MULTISPECIES: hypothetical protein [Halostella]NHN46239.1 hypothetical protein [Halostella sp. JP-L12]
MDDSDDRVRVWLVERDLDQRNLVTLVYATPDGDRRYRRQLSSAALDRGADVTAATTVAPADLEPVEDPDRRKQYAEEARRVADDRDPDEPL